MPQKGSLLGLDVRWPAPGEGLYVNAPVFHVDTGPGHEGSVKRLAGRSVTVEWPVPGRRPVRRIYDREELVSTDPRLATVTKRHQRGWVTGLRT
jgi:hypothetical protein